MISVQEAKTLIKNHISPLKNKKVKLESSLGAVLAEDIYAPLDLPPFPQSSMDGYAFDLNGWKHGSPLRVTSVVAAGNTEDPPVKAGEAVRIFTGAPLPTSCNVVVKQENVNMFDDNILINQEEVSINENVRTPGSEITKGTLGLEAGFQMTPPAIGFLASMGIDTIEILPSPRVTILVTGDELVGPGTRLKRGQIYESNAKMLTAALSQLGITAIKVKHIHDQLEAHTTALKEALTDSDLVLFSGGISVGDYDFVAKANEEAGVKTIFHKIKQKPGKPLFFGMHGEIPVFGLPGNPASVMSCYYNYITLAIQQLTSRPCRPVVAFARLAGDYKKPEDMTHFLKGKFLQETVEILDGQESYRLNSFALANCLIEMETSKDFISKGDWVKVHLINKNI